MKRAVVWSLVGLGAANGFVCPASLKIIRLISTASSSTELAAGKGFGAARAKSNSTSDPQLLYYHQQSAGAAATEFLRFNSQPKKTSSPSNDAIGERSGMRVFDRVVDFPCKFTIKVIGEPDNTFDKDILAYVGEVTGKPWEEIEYSARDTNSGRYRSLTIHAPVANADELYAIYERVGSDKRVKFKF